MERHPFFWRVGYFHLVLSTGCPGSAPESPPVRKRPPVPQRAQEIAAEIAEMLGVPAGFARVEAVKGYLNLYFRPAEYTRRVVDTVLAQAADFGRGAPKSERVMVEYAQPNTHHSFHIGHSRNALLGEALARLVEFAGFETIRASYPGRYRPGRDHRPVGV